MALITCPECGKEISDRATSCPNCGFPINNAAYVPQQSITVVENTAVAPIKCTRKIGPVQIDENNRMFRIAGSIPVNGKQDGISKSIFKGMLAVSTMGMSVAAEKMLGVSNNQKVGDKTWLNFSDLVNYNLLENDSVVTSGGVGQALIGGALFGGAGAIAGGLTAKRVHKKNIESLIIRVTLNNFHCPCLIIPLITRTTKINSKEYETASNLAYQILSALDVIAHNQ